MDGAPAVRLPDDLAARLTQWHGSDLVTGLRDRLAGIAAAAADGTVTVGFAGHFSSGKSSVLNALLRREVLPTSDFPETGVPCWIRRGDHDRAVAQRNGQVSEISVDPAAIGALTSLVSDAGDYRREPLDVTGLWLTVTGGSVPAGMIWADLPGVNDTERMTDRATAAIGQLDVLVWVIDSRRPMSQTDQEHLRGLTEQHGIEDFVFVVNAFLDEDSAAGWQRFQDRAAAFQYRRIAEADLVMVPEVGYVSARAAIAEPDKFGAPQTRRLVESLRDSRSARVLAARRRKAATSVRTLIADLEPLTERTTHWLTARRVEWENQRAEADRRVQGLRAVLNPAVDWHLHRHAPGVEHCGRTTAYSVMVAGPLRRDGFYEYHLTNAIHTVVDVFVAELLPLVARRAVEHGFSAPPPQVADELRMALKPPRVEFEVPISAPDDSVRAKLAERAGGIVRRPSSVAIGQDRSAAQENAMAAAAGAAAGLLAQRDKILDLLLAACRRPEPLLPAPDEGSLRALEELREFLDKAATELAS